MIELCYENIDVTPESIMLGDSFVNGKTEFSDALNDQSWKTNSILLKLGKKVYVLW